MSTHPQERDAERADERRLDKARQHDDTGEGRMAEGLAHPHGGAGTPDVEEQIKAQEDAPEGGA